MFYEKSSKPAHKPYQRQKTQPKGKALEDNRSNQSQFVAQPASQTHGAVISRFVNPGAVARGWYGFPDHFTISDDGTAATGQRGDKYLYSTTGRRDEANQNLTAAGSVFRVVNHPGGGNFNLADRYGGHRINRLQVRIADGVGLPNGVTVDGNRAVTESPADCMRTAERVVGRGLHAYGHVTQGAGNLPAIERLVTLGRASNLPLANIQALVDLYVNYFEANKRVVAFNNAYGAHRNDLDQDAIIVVQLESYRRDPAGFDIQQQADVPSPTAVSGIQQMFDHWRVQRDQYLQQLAALEAHHNLNAAGQVQERQNELMDRRADPEVGQAYTSLAGGVKRQGESYWNYHWGGVIMKTSTDNVTFENHAGLANPAAWDVRMYGRPRVVPPAPNTVAPSTTADPKAGQSWHEIWSERDFGDNPSTFTGR